MKRLAATAAAAEAEYKYIRGGGEWYRLLISSMCMMASVQCNEEEAWSMWIVQI